MSAPAPKRQGACAGSDDDRRTTRVDVSGPVMQIGQAILVAVIILIILGELFAIGLVAEPWFESDPTATVTENQTVAAGANQALNVTTADWYYDNGTHAETVTNASNGTTLAEGTGYEFYTNGTISNPTGAEIKYGVTYSYFSMNTFQALYSTFASYGETAYIMIGLGLIALGASVALSYFGGFGGGGGR